MRISSRAIIIENESVLLMYRRKTDSNGNIKEYYVVPGGGIDENENLETAAKRELFEELGIEIEILNYIGLEETPQGFSNYYDAKITSGTPKLGGEELERMTSDNYYEPMFVHVNQLKDKNVFGIEHINLTLAKTYSKLNNATLTDQGICPTCYDKQNNHIIFGDNSHQMIYKDNLIEIFFAGTPRKKGHTIISSVKHYKDIMEIDSETLTHSMLMAQKTMNALKNVLGCESVYLCTMCDGPSNHYHLQLLPRYENEERGSKNFVSPRIEYIHDENLIDELKQILNSEV